MKKLLLLLNMGGPRNLDEVSMFLKNMFNDPYILGIKNEFFRSMLAKFITKVRLKKAIYNYQQIGGKSPMVSITQNLCDKISGFSDEFVVDFAMNYTPPFPKDVLLKHKDVSEIVVFPLYPHHSSTTILSSLNSFYNAYNKLKLKMEARVVKPFYDSFEFNNLIVDDIKGAVNGVDVSDIHMVFSAHSLPKKIIDSGDLYEVHIKAQLEILKNILEENKLYFKSVSLAYQSRIGPVKWLEPSLSDVLSNLKGKKALIYPMSFCVDNSESIFELAVEYKHMADELGFEYYNVVSCPNDTDEFARFILNHIKEWKLLSS